MIFLARMMVAHANLSSRDTSRRVARARRADTEAGRPHVGGRAFGYGTDGLIVVVEAALIREAYERLLDGATGYSIIAVWNTRGLRTVKGKPWSYTTLRTVLTNPRVAGLAYRARAYGPQVRESGLWEIVKRADGSEVRGLWPAIAEREAWAAVCEWFRQTSIKRGGGTARNTRRYLLSGLLRCGNCGAKMHGQYRNGGYPPIYACAGVSKGGCGGLSRVAPPIEEHVVQAVLAKYERKLADRRAATGSAEPLV